MSANANADAGAAPGMEARAADLLSRWRAAFETGDPRAAETLYSEIAALAALPDGAAGAVIHNLFEGIGGPALIVTCEDEAPEVAGRLRNDEGDCISGLTAFPWRPVRRQRVRAGVLVRSDVLVRVRRARAGILVCFLAGRGRRRGPVKKLGKRFQRPIRFLRSALFDCGLLLPVGGGFRYRLRRNVGLPVCDSESIFRNLAALVPVLGGVRLAGCIDHERGSDAARASCRKYPEEKFHLGIPL